MSANNIIFLENFIDSTFPLPAEVERIMHSIRALDEKQERLMQEVQLKVERCLQYPAVGPARPGRPPGEPEEVTVLRREIEEDHKLINQWAEEKVYLAGVGHEMIEHFLGKLDSDLSMFEEELRLGGMFDPGEDSYGVQVINAPQDSGRGGGGMLVKGSAAARSIGGGLNNMDGGGPPSNPASRKTSVQLGPTGEPDPTVLPGPTPRGPGLPAGFPPPPPVGGPIGGPMGGPMGGAAEGHMARKQSRKQSLGPGVSGASEHMDVDGSGPGEVDERSKPMPPGFSVSSRQPQSRGPTLSSDMIGPVLEGRHAELYWPPDGMWYLIEIQSVDVVRRTARIIYMTGEIEEALNLDDVARDKQMLLVN